MKRLRPLLAGAQLVVGAVLLWSSFWKLYQPYEFLRSVYNYDLFSQTVGLYIASFVPWLQLIVGSALILNLLELAALFISSSMFATFSLIESISLYNGQQIPCGCFGSSDDPISAQQLSLTISLLVASSLAFVSKWLGEKARTV